MKRIEIEGCTVDIVPVIRGLVSERIAVLRALDDGYDAVGAAAGPEDITGYAKRNEIEEDGISSLDAVYLHFLKNFGETDFPDPSYSALADACLERSISLIPLDMDDETFSEKYCENVGTMELLKETNLAGKLYKKKFDLSSPERFVKEWDDSVNMIRGLRKMSEEREDFIAESIRRAARGKKRVLAVLDAERVDGIVEDLTGDSLDL